MQSKFGGGLLIALAILAGLAITLAALHWFLPDAGRFKDLAGIVQSVVTVLAIITGGIIAAYKLQLFRDFEPHLTISHAINHRSIGDGYVHIDVNATLHNSSRVKVELREGVFHLQQIAPVLDDQELEERLAVREFSGENRAFVQWPSIGELSCDWGNYNLIVEPGQVYRETVEFIVPKEIATVAIHSIFYPATPPRRASQGWGITTVYDMIDKSSDVADR